jgi:hypothetical protein
MEKDEYNSAKNKRVMWPSGIKFSGAHRIKLGI